MKSATTRTFGEQLAELPKQVQRQARKQFCLWRHNPQHPSLRFKKVSEYWSARINDDYRAVARFHGDTCYWFTIRSHKDYDEFLRSR